VEKLRAGDPPPSNTRNRAHSAPSFDSDELRQALCRSAAIGAQPKDCSQHPSGGEKALGDAEKKGWLSRNVAASTTLPKMLETEMHCWNLDEVRLFLDSVRNDRLQALYHLALTTGMRRGELCGLRKKDVDLTIDSCVFG
jgi:site-specific recombinase XerD